jgi:hypothetical protein
MAVGRSAPRGGAPASFAPGFGAYPSRFAPADTRSPSPRSPVSRSSVHAASNEPWSLAGGVAHELKKLYLPEAVDDFNQRTAEPPALPSSRAPGHTRSSARSAPTRVRRQRRPRSTRRAKRPPRPRADARLRRSDRARSPTPAQSIANRATGRSSSSSALRGGRPRSSFGATPLRPGACARPSPATEQPCSERWPGNTATNIRGTTTEPRGVPSEPRSSP